MTFRGLATRTLCFHYNLWYTIGVVGSETFVPTTTSTICSSISKIIHALPSRETQFTALCINNCILRFTSGRRARMPPLDLKFTASSECKILSGSQGAFAYHPSARQRRFRTKSRFLNPVYGKSSSLPLKRVILEFISNRIQRWNKDIGTICRTNESRIPSNGRNFFSLLPRQSGKTLGASCIHVIFLRPSDSWSWISTR